MKTLEISDTLSLPLDAITQKFAILGTSGSGKSYTAMKLAELMLDHDAQIIAVDPVGIWWSLRLAADGKSEGYKQVVVFGGEHGDLPLTPESGSLVARMLAERAIPAVLDVSQFITSEQIRFLAAFGEQFFESKKSHKSPIHLFLEECQTVVPQEPARDENTMLNRWRRLIKFGRNYGVGFSMVSQQPQAVDKKVLNEAPTLFAMRTVGSHQRKAILAWVKDVIESESDLVASLPKLPTGTAHLWSPEWLKVSRDIHISPKKTFDAGKTPEIGTHAKQPQPLTKIDVEQFKGAMAEMIERVKADDPKELKKKIAELQRQLAKPNSSPVQRDSTPDPRHIERAVSAALKPIREQLRQIKMHAGRAARSLPIVQGALEDIEKSLAEVPVQENQETSVSITVGRIIDDVVRHPKPLIPVRAPMPVAPIHESRSERAIASSNGDLTGPERKILRALAELLSIGKEQAPKNMVAAWSGYSPLGGAFGNPIGALRSKGLIDYPQPGTVTLTEAGRNAVGVCKAPDQEEIWRRIESTCTGPEQKILRALIDNAGDGEIAKEQLAEKAGYSPVGGAFGNPIGALRTKGLLDYPRQGVVKAADWLFAA